MRNTLLRGRSDGRGPSTVRPVRSGRVINNKDGADTVCTGDGTGNVLLCRALPTQRSQALKAANLSPSKRFTVQPDWEVTIPALGVRKCCPRSDCLHGFDKVTVR